MLDCFLWLLYIPPLLLPFRLLQPPMLWSTRPPPPKKKNLREGGRGGVVLRLQPGRRVSGVCYFCRPIASTRVAQGWLFIVLPRRVAGRGRGGGVSGPCTVTMETVCRQHQSAVLQGVPKITPWGSCGGAGWDTDSPNVHQFLFNPSWSHVVVVFPRRALN